MKLHIRKDALRMLCGKPRRLIPGDRMVSDTRYPRREMCESCRLAHEKVRR